jgi:NTE family protein
VTTGRASNGKKRALVLGGGGPVGVAWESGLAAGLAAGGVQLSVADRVIGTSAGSITGAFLAGGEDPVELSDQVASLFARSIAETGVDQLPAAGLAPVMDALLDAVAETDPTSLRDLLVKVGHIALAAETIPEDSFVASITLGLGDRAWPPSFRCTAIDVESGEFVVWDDTAGVPLPRAVAASCSVPGIYPPVTIDGRRYMDGGARSPLNADLADGHDAVVIVSVMPLELPAGFSDPRFDRFFAAQHEQIDSLRHAGADVALIAPDDEFLALSGYGMHLMDFTRTTPAVEAGVRLGKLEAERIGRSW